MQLLVTGGGGFIGSHLVQRLVRDGHRVRVVDNFTTGHRRNLQPVFDDIELVEGDLQSYERAHAAVRGCEVVLHQAAMPSVPRSIQDPLTSNASNVIGTLNVLLAARDSGVRRVVYASSSSVYGANPGLPKDESLPTLPISPYAVAKLASEGYCRSLHRGLRPGDRRAALLQRLRPAPGPAVAVLGGHPELHHRGAARRRARDLRRRRAVARLHVHRQRRRGEPPGDVRTRGAGRMYNIALGDRISLNQLVASIGEVLGRTLEARHEAPRPGDVRHSMADTTRAQEELGYRTVIDFKDGLARTIEYYTEAAERASLVDA